MERHPDRPSQSTRRSRSAAGKDGFGLRWALGLSVLLHLLLILATGWVPLVPSESAAFEPDAETIRFRFAPTEEADPEGEQRGEIPLPLPEFEPAELTPLEPPIEEIPIEPAPDALPEEQPSTESAEPQEPSEAELDAGAASPPPPGEFGTPGETRKQFDLGQALADFQRAIDRSRDLERSGPPPQVGKQIFLPQPISVPMPGVATGTIEFESRDYDWNEYGQMIHGAILRAWYQRLYQTVSEFERWAQANRWVLDDDNRIRFVIERRGNVSGISLMLPSGVPPLDDSAMDALRQVVLPPLPADFPRDREVVKARFIAKLPIYTTNRYEFIKVGGRYVLWDSARGRVVSDHPSAIASAHQRSFMREYLNALKRIGIF